MKRFSEQKALAAILYLINKTGKIDLYALLKTLYYADKYHFQQWGRTITSDTYYRRRLGPVPSKIYDMLKSVRGDGVWSRDLSGSFDFVDPITIIPKTKADLERLSQTDIEELDKSFAERGQNEFIQLCEEVHQDPAFKRSQREEMTEDDFTEDDPVLLEHLKETRENEQYLKAWRYLPPHDEEAVC